MTHRSTATGSEGTALPERAPPSTGAPLPDRPFRLLLVEDNPGDVRLFEARLRDAAGDYGLEAAGSPEEAGRALESPRPDLCFLDLGLPASSGAETVEDFRSVAGEVPVVVLTGLEGLADVVAAIDGFWFEVVRLTGE